MEAVSLSRYKRISVKKLCKVSRALENLSYIESIYLLKRLPQKAAYLLKRELLSAGANLKHAGSSKDEKDWKIKSIVINQGPVYKRLSYRAKHSSDRLRKPTSHIRVVIQDF